MVQLFHRRHRRHRRNNQRNRTLVGWRCAQKKQVVKDFLVAVWNIPQHSQFRPRFVEKRTWVTPKLSLEFLGDSILLFHILKIKCFSNRFKNLEPLVVPVRESCLQYICRDAKLPLQPVVYFLLPYLRNIHTSHTDVVWIIRDTTFVCDILNARTSPLAIGRIVAQRPWLAQQIALVFRQHRSVQARQASRQETFRSHDRGSSSIRF